MHTTGGRVGASTALGILLGGMWLAVPPRPLVAAQQQAAHVIASVSEGRGRAVTGLGPADFVVDVGGRKADVLSVTVDPRPAAVVVIMDGAESHEALYVRAALQSVLKVLRQAPGTRVGLMLGERGASAPTLHDAFEDGDALSRRVARFFRSEVTAPPQDALAGAAEALAREEVHRRLVVVLSVNRRTDRVQVPETLVPALRASDITMVSLEVSAGAGVTSTDPALRLIQSVVGGRFERVADVTGLESAAVRVVSGLLTAYRVTYAVPADVAGRPEVSVPARRNATVVAPAWNSR